MPPSTGVATRSSLAADLAALGVKQNDVLCVHSSLRALGHVIGGTRTVVEGLIDAVGPAGTLMMPTYSGDLSDPENWCNPPVAPEYLERVRQELPAYDRVLTPSRGMGAVAEYFRRYPGVQRSDHPQSSFAALGPQAAALVGRHPLDDRFGPNSPLGALPRIGGKVLLLGAPRNTCSLFYLTQHLLGWKERDDRASPMSVEGARVWVDYGDIRYTDAFFADAIAFLVETGVARCRRVGAAESILFPAQAGVDDVVVWRRKFQR